MPNELQHIRTFDKLVIFLQDEIGWQLGNYSFENLTFEYDPEELGLTGEVAAKVKNIHQLRPAAAGQPWGIFFVEFESQKMPVQALRRILSSLVVKKRAATNAAHRAAFKPADLLFIARFGTDKSPEIAFARFHQEDKKSIPSLQILGWNGDEAPPRLARVKQILQDGLAWPDDKTDHTAWRDQWAKAFEQVVVAPDIQLKINQHIVQTYIKAGSGATGYMRAGELSHAALLKASAIERLTEEEEYALFIHIDELKNGIPNDLYALGFLTQRCIEVADTLLKGKERFDQVIQSRKIESRERYMKGLPKLCEHLESIHKECEEILFCNSDISEVKTTEQRKRLAENLEKRRNIMLRFHFNELVMEKFYEYVDAYDRKYQACQRNLRNEPDDTTLRDELVSYERNSWLAPDEWNKQFGAISKARKEIALLRDILMRSCFSQGEACAKGHAARGLEHEELLGEGMKGIANAVMTFNVSLGKRLSARA